MANGDGIANGIGVDLSGRLMRSDVGTVQGALRRGVLAAGDTAIWAVEAGGGQFQHVANNAVPTDWRAVLVVRTRPTNTPAWQRMFVEALGVDGFADVESESRGAVLLVWATSGDERRIVAWSFGSGFHLIRPSAADPRFGLMVALNALAEAGDESGGGVKTARISTREPGLRKAQLTASAPSQEWRNRQSRHD